MVSLESDSQPRYSYANNQRSCLFNKGEEVEVSSDEDGLRGAWYTATIVDTPAKSASKKRKKVTVEYKTLVTEDFAPLKEIVDACLVRPLPPKDSGGGDKVFQENDVVDAGYRDGWWTGIVRTVLEGSRYRVYFDNPPDIIDFDGKDLRTHWEWINDKWVQSEKQQTTGSIFSSGTAVEVNIDKENVRDAWFPSVVIKENGDNSFLVKYQSSGNNDEAGIKVVVDSHHIRPVPPHYADRDYELLEKVDAHYGFGWRAGLITKLLAGRRYNVFFKQGNEDKELNHSEIRPHAEWIDGKWIFKSKEVMIASDDQKQLSSAHNCKGLKNLVEQSTHCTEKSSAHVLPPSKKVKLGALNGTGDCSRPSKMSAEEDAVDVPVTVASFPLAKMPIETTAKETIHGLAISRTVRKRTKYSKKPMIGDQAAAQTENFLGGKRDVAPSLLIRIKELPEKTKQKKALDMDRQKVDIVTKKGRITKSPFGRSQILETTDVTHINESEDKGVPLVIALEARGTQLSGEETLKFMRDRKKNLNDSVGGKIAGLDQQKPGGSSQRRKRGRPRKLILAKALEAGKEDYGMEDALKEIFVRDQTINEVELPIQTGLEFTVSQVASREEATEVSETDCMAKEVDIAIATVSNDVVDEDQPLSMWIGGMHSSASAEELRLSSKASNGWNETRGRDVDLVLVSSGNEAPDESTSDGNQCLPFVKRSPIWKTIESMEVFQISKQKPHFHPLADCKEEYREGSAIGIMVTFASLFEKITSLQFDDSKSVLESTLESLLDLERHGFDVTMPRDRVNELVWIKDGKEELLNESKDIETQMREHTDEKRKLEANIYDVEKKIIKLQEELSGYKSNKDNKDIEITRLQLHMDSVSKRLTDARKSFKKVASAAWKLP